ncbi:DUF6503 family protein [Lishizhenia sp.]|uniref:DUF6503 family protein n=1 Tax=Lishizhenia sp. TaxID=2497594 RepID=UPI00299F0465|nr:DUF6503 family protein [Lishizhenia sp.]MDX1444676.1 hypothetical protein [Lishizhenia sp.]
MKKLLIPITSLLLFSCSVTTTEKSQTELPLFIKEINTHHHYEKFKQAGVFTADIKLTFGGKQRLDAKMIYDTQTQETALLHRDGKALMFTEDTVWLSPDTANYPRARFDIFTWSYFMALPYKLNDNGIQLEEYAKSNLGGKNYNAQRLTFGENIGDAPDDWYILYQDQKSGLLHAAAYIVSLGKDQKTAEEDPHAIVYKKYVDVDGIPMATSWEFYAWDKEKGLTKKLGEATLSKLQFVERTDDIFQVPLPKKEVTI